MYKKLQEPKYIEVESGEIRHVCLICDTPIKPVSRLYCKEHENGFVYACKYCGKPATGDVCQECIEGFASMKRDKAVIHRSQIRNGKRILTEMDRPLVEKWWEEGATGREIAKRLGLDCNQPNSCLSHKRIAMGWNLPYRSPHAVELGRALSERGHKALAKKRAAA